MCCSLPPATLWWKSGPCMHQPVYSIFVVTKHNAVGYGSFSIVRPSGGQIWNDVRVRRQRDMSRLDVSGLSADPGERGTWTWLNDWDLWGSVFETPESRANCIFLNYQLRVTPSLAEEIMQVATGLAADARWEGSDPSSSWAFSDRAQSEVGGRWCIRCPAASELSYFWPTGPRHASKGFRVAIAISLGGHAAITQSLISGREL